MTAKWMDLDNTDTSPSLTVRILWRIAAFLIIIGGAILIWFLSGVHDDLMDNRRIQKEVSNANTAKSIEQHIRTQTLICMAHPEIRETDRTFNQICTDVVRSWQVNAQQE